MLALQQQQPHLSYEEAKRVMVAGKGRWTPRDYFIKTYDVFNQLAKFEKLLFRKHTNDAQSVRLYQEEHKNKVRGGLQHRVCWTQGSTQGHNSTSGVCGGGDRVAACVVFLVCGGEGVGGGGGRGAFLMAGREAHLHVWLPGG